MVTCHHIDQYDLTIWQTEESEKMHPDYIPDKEVRYLEADIAKERTDTLLKNFLEFDPEIIEHHDPNSFFCFDLGGEG